VTVKPSRKEVLEELASFLGDKQTAEAAITTCGIYVRTDPHYVMTITKEEEA
jgi:hypothetical protein